jgi:acetyl esterase/lipase
MSIDRRMLLGAGALGAAALAMPRAAQAARITELFLWPKAPPGPGSASGPERVSDKGKSVGAVSNVTHPRLRIYRPAQPNGAAVLVIGGGGYFRIEIASESTPACEWLASLGFVAAELYYRMPADGWSRGAPFADAQRAMRLMRAQAGQLGFDAPKLAILGFSAGGHLAGMTAAAADVARYQPVDDADSHSARPALAGLIYPVITLKPPFDTTRSKKELVGLTPTPADSAEWSVETHVDQRTPPTFLAQAADDPISPIDNSLIMFDALCRANVQREMHVFQQGGHGWGLGERGSAVGQWPALFQNFVGRNGLPRT